MLLTPSYFARVVIKSLGIYQSDALSMGLNNGVKPSTMPLTVSDGSYDLRDHFFTPPYPHPSCECGLVYSTLYLLVNNNSSR